MALKNLNQFYATLRDRGAKLNHQFQIQLIPDGAIVDASVTNALQDVTMFAEGATLPGRTLKNATIPYMGYELSVPTVADMTKELSLTIKVDRTMDIHKACLQWLAGHSRLNVGTELANGGGSKAIPNSQVVLWLLAEDMTNVSQTFVLYGAYPTTVGDISLTNAEPEIMSFEMGLAFQYWDYTLDSSGGSVNIAGL